MDAESLTYIKKLETELKIRGFSINTIKAYRAHNTKFLLFINKSVTTANSDDIKLYMAHLISDKGLKMSSVSLHMSALRFLYDEMLEKGLFAKIKMPKLDKKIPHVLTREEIRTLLKHITNKKHNLLLKTLYSSGLRISECVSLKINDIDLDEKMGKVIGGKGKKDRYFIISDSLLKDLTKFLNKRKDNNPFLFFYKDHHIGVRQAQKILTKAADGCNMTKRVFPHALRSSFATHLLESGTDIRIIQELLGHSNLATTQRYTKVSTEQLKKVKSPMDNL